MTLAEDIVTLLRAQPQGLSDAELARATGKLHQAVNQRCRALADQGFLRRDTSSGVIRNVLVELSAGTRRLPQPRGQATRPGAGRSRSAEWFWEGNVQSSLCGWLVQQRWSLMQVMNTASRQHGTDIEACRGDVQLHVEVKGYPSKSYADPRRADESKPTQPTVQAGHWYAHALLKVREDGSVEEL